MKVNLSEPGKPGDDFALKALSYLYRDTKAAKKGDQTGRPEKSKAGVALEKRHVRERLEKLSADDVDPAVRGAAQYALGRLAALQGTRR